MTSTLIESLRTIPTEVTPETTPTTSSQFDGAELRRNLQHMKQTEQAERDRRAELERRRELARLD